MPQLFFGLFKGGNRAVWRVGHFKQMRGCQRIDHFLFISGQGYKNISRIPPFGGMKKKWMKKKLYSA